MNSELDEPARRVKCSRAHNGNAKVEYRGTCGGTFFPKRKDDLVNIIHTRWRAKKGIKLWPIGSRQAMRERTRPMSF